MAKLQLLIPRRESFLRFNIQCSQAFKFLLVCFFLVSPAISYASVVKSIHFEWGYDTALPNLAGYTLYRNNQAILEIRDPSALSIDYDVSIEGGTNIFTMTAFDQAGNRSAPSEPYIIEIPPEDGSGNILPLAQIQASFNTGEAPLIVDFDAGGSVDYDGTIVEYDWDFGDGTSAVGESVGHMFETGGVYTVTLVVKDDGGETSVDEATITVNAPAVSTNEPPVASVKSDVASGDAPLLVNFDANDSYDPDGYIVQYSWNFGDGEKAAGRMVDHTFQAPGVYQVIASVTDNEGALAEKEIAITVNGSYEPHEIAINFQPPDSPVPDGYLKDSGLSFDETRGYGWVNRSLPVGSTRDRNSSLSPDQAYDTLIRTGPSDVWELAVPNGRYAVEVCMGDATWPEGVQNVQVEGLPVVVDGLLSRDVPWLQEQQVVDVNDGMLTVTFNDTDPEVLISWIRLSPVTDNAPPVPVIKANVTTGDAPLQVQFDGSSSVDPDGMIVSYDWDINGVSVGAAQFANYTFFAPGVYTVTFSVMDDDGAVGQASTTITVKEPSNSSPVAMDGTLTVNEDGSNSGLLNANDAEGDWLTYTIVSTATKGVVTLANPSTGAYTYTPYENANGSDWFSFKVNDGSTDSNMATVNITILPVNDVPIASDDAAETGENAPVVIDVLANDTDVDGDTLEVTYVSQGANGTATISGNKVIYTPSATFSGTDSFSYDIVDGKGGSATGTVTVTVNAANKGSWQINFQPARSLTPDGYSADSGKMFDETRGYGWVNRTLHAGATRERKSSLSPDQAYDTLIRQYPTDSWELAVPNGRYAVEICMGDATWPEGFQNAQAEGVSIINNQLLSKDRRWVVSKQIVEVKDGRLTLTFNGSDSEMMLDWVKVVSAAN